MKYFIGTPEQAFNNQKTHNELSRALHQTNTKPSYDDQVIYVYDDQDNLIQTISPGDNKFLQTKVWFYNELHRLQNTYGFLDIRGSMIRKFPKLEEQLKDKLLK